MLGDPADSAKQRPRAIRNPQDFYGGLALVAVAVVALWALRNLPGMKGLRFGPGTAPRLFAWALAVAGMAVSLIGLLGRRSAAVQYAVRGPLVVMAAVLVFAVTIKPLGLVTSTLITTLVTAGASTETRWREIVLWAIVLALSCAFLFAYVLNLPLPLWPQF